MQRALEMMVVEGIKTTIPLHIKIMKNEKFQKLTCSAVDFKHFLKENLIFF